MREVIGVGATIHAPTPEEYRQELRSWSREAEEAGDLAEVWSDDEIEAEVASRADMLDVSVTLFAELSDGTRVATGEIAGLTTSGIYAWEGPAPRPFEDFTAEHTASWALEDWRSPATGIEARWSELVYALEQAGIDARAADLDAAPFRVEWTDALLARIRELRAIPPREG